MKILVSTILTCILTLASFTALAQSQPRRSAEYEIMVCRTWGAMYAFKQRTIYLCGADDKKMTVDQVYAQGYRLVGVYGVGDTNSSPQVSGNALYFERKK